MSLNVATIILLSSDSSFASCVSSLPPTVCPLLECQIDKDDELETDLQLIAHHILEWNTTLAVHLKLSKEDIHDIQHKFFQSGLQR